MHRFVVQTNAKCSARPTIFTRLADPTQPVPHSLFWYLFSQLAEVDNLVFVVPRSGDGGVIGVPRYALAWRHRVPLLGSPHATGKMDRRTYTQPRAEPRSEQALIHERRWTTDPVGLLTAARLLF